jgi:hypothetical protein
MDKSLKKTASLCSLFFLSFESLKKLGIPPEKKLLAGASYRTPYSTREQELAQQGAEALAWRCNSQPEDDRYLLRVASGSGATRGRGQEEQVERWWRSKRQTQQPTREQEGCSKMLAQQEAERWRGSVTTNQRTRGTRGKRREAVAQQEAEEEWSAVRGGGATRGRCKNQPENKRGAARGWRNERQRG